MTVADHRAPAPAAAAPQGPLPTLRIIDPDGPRGRTADHASQALSGRIDDVLSDPGALSALHRDLVVLRRIDRLALALARQGELALWAPVAGQEAVLAGAARALGPREHLFISYREALMAYLRGVPPRKILPMWRGSALAGWDPAEYGVTNPEIIVGAHALHATGYAMAAALDGADEAAVAFFGDGATSQGDLAEALNTAAVTAAPVVFFCQNNHFAISVPVGGQTAVQPAQRAYGFGIPALRVDGNDALAVLAATRIAAEHVHGGSGPFFVEAVTYRMGPHTTNDDPSRYRSAAETEAWAARDPVERLAAYLRGRGILTQETAQAADAHAEQSAHAFREACRSLPEPRVADIFEHVYAAPHPLIEEERRAYGEYLSYFAAADVDGPSGPAPGPAADEREASR